MNTINKNHLLPCKQTMGTSKVIHQSPKEPHHHSIGENTQHQQKISVELRSSTGLPLEAPLEISYISLTYRGSILSECHLPGNYNNFLSHYEKIHCVDNKLSIDILKYGMLFLNGTISFSIPYQHIDLNELSIVIQYRSQKPVKVDVLVIQNAHEYYFGELSVSQTSHWEESHLSFNKNSIHITTQNEQSELLIDNIVCINKHNEDVSLIHPNEKFCFVIDYTLTNKNLFEQMQILILLKENTTAHSYNILTQDLKFNPFSSIGKIITSIDCSLLPGEYTVTLLLSKKGYHQSKKHSFLRDINMLEGLHLKYINHHPLSIKVVESNQEYLSHIAYPLENEEWNILAYN